MVLTIVLLALGLALTGGALLWRHLDDRRVRRQRETGLAREAARHRDAVDAAAARESARLAEVDRELAARDAAREADTADAFDAAVDRVRRE